MQIPSNVSARVLISADLCRMSHAVVSDTDTDTDADPDTDTNTNTHTDADTNTNTGTDTDTATDAETGRDTNTTVTSRDMNNCRVCKSSIAGLQMQIQVEILCRMS